MKGWFETWLASSAGQIVAGLACVAIFVWIAAWLWTSPDGLFATFGWIAPFMIAVAPMMLFFGARLVWTERGLPTGGKRGPAAPWWGKRGEWALLVYMALAIAVVVIWIQPALQSDRLLTGFDRELVIAEGDPVLLVPGFHRVGSVATTGHYDRRYGSERTYVGLELDSDAPDAVDDTEARIEEDAFGEPSGLGLEMFRIRPGPSGSAVLLITEDYLDERASAALQRRSWLASAAA